MLILAIDTAGDTGGVALGRPGGPVHKRLFRRPERFESALFAAVEAVLADGGGAQPELVALGLGPGSYTGLRIGMAGAKGLAMGWGVPLKGVASDEVLLAEVKAAARALVVWPDRRGAVTAAAFCRTATGWEQEADYRTTPAAEFVSHADANTVLCGPAAGLVAEAAGRDAARGPADPDPAILLELAWAAYQAPGSTHGADDLLALVPRYLRVVAPVYQAPPAVQA